MKRNKILKFIIIIIVIIIVIVAIAANGKLIDNTTNNQNTEILNEKVQEENNLTKEENIMDDIENSEEISINIIVNDKTFTATLYNNETVKELITHFPMTLNMSELHSNEKYNYLDFNLTTDSYTPSKINAGDIKLYGNNCLVVFYESFSNSYNYTDLGTIDDVDGFIQELGNGEVMLIFELK